MTSVSTHLLNTELVVEGLEEEEAGEDTEDPQYVVLSLAPSNDCDFSRSSASR